MLRPSGSYGVLVGIETSMIMGAGPYACRRPHRGGGRVGDGAAPSGRLAGSCGDRPVQHRPGRAGEGVVGRRTVKVAPVPGCAAAVMVPPWLVTTSRSSARPRP